MTETMRVYVGDGSILDGAMFHHSRIIYHDETTFTAVSGENRGEYERVDIQVLVDEINSGQPGRITAVPKDESFMAVRVECHDGVLFESNGMVASGEELRSSGDLRRQFTRAFRHHGGSVSENY